MSGAMSVEMILKLVDQFVGPLRSAESELKNFERTAKELQGSSAQGGKRRAADWVEEQRALRAAQGDLEGYRRKLDQVREAQLALVEAWASRKLAQGAEGLAHRAFEAGKEGAHSEASLISQGNSPEDIAEIQKRAAALSRQFKQFDRSTIESMIADAKTFVGTLEHASEAMPELLQLRQIQQGLHGRTSDKDFGYLAKALEQGGVANDPAKRAARTDTFARWMQVYRDTFSVDDINQFYQGLKGPIARSLSENFLRGAGGHFIQEMGGHAFGNALTQMDAAITAGRMQPRAAAEMKELGLLRAGKFVPGGPFGVRAVMPGGVEGGDLFRHDPQRWVEEVLAPKLAKLKPEKREEAISALFTDQTSRNIVDKLLNQSAVIAKDAAQIAGAPGREKGAGIWDTKDPAMGFSAFGSQFKNIMRDAGKAPTEWANSAAAKGAAWLSAVGKASEEHPTAATLGVGAGAAGLGYGAWKLGSAALERSLGLLRGTGAAAEGAQGLSTGGKLSSVLKGLGDGIKEGAKLAEGDLGLNPGAMASIGKSLLSALGKGLLAGIATEAASYGIDKLFGGREQLAKDRANINAKASEWWNTKGAKELSLVSSAHAEEHPTAAAGGGTPASQAVEAAKSLNATTIAPKVDMSGFEQVTSKTNEAKAALDKLSGTIVKINVDASGLDQVVSKAAAAQAAISKLGASARAASAGVSPGLGSLHDGPEQH